jgi:GNAT superfamily N-acetyltransferase
MTAQFSLLFPNPPLQSLQLTQKSFALTAPRACKFPRQIIPFAAVTENSPEAFADLHSLMEPGESTFLISYEPPATSTLTCTGPFDVPQLEWPETLPLPQLPANDSKIEQLTCANAAEMVALTDVAFPGFFRIRTCELGPYFGIRSSGQLVAMCGERMNIGNFRELSGLCTHPDHRGKGYAQLLLTHLMQNHRAAGLRSYLHVSAENKHAIDLYLRMGFVSRGQFPMYRLTRND